MDKLTPRLLSLYTLSAFCSPVFAEDSDKPHLKQTQPATQTQSEIPEATWGLAGVMRSASVPYSGIDEFSDSDRVNTFIPMLYFENEYVYVKGLTLGGYLYNPAQSDWNVSALTRLRFVDIPADYQNKIGADAADFGLRSEYSYAKHWYGYSEIMSDKSGNWHVNLGTEGEYQFGGLQLQPHASLRYKSKDFNTLYYGLDLEKVDAGVDYFVGVRASYHLVSNLYLLGAANLQILDGSAKDASIITDSLQNDFYVGIGFFNDRDKPLKTALSNKPYIRVSHGWGTPSNLGDILGGDIEDDPYDSQITTLFYGHPLTDELFGLPLDIYLTPGFGWHWSNDNQASNQEYILAIKAYYTISWPFDWRLGVAEGMSYTTKINSLEKEEFKEKGYEPNNFLNYLDFSIDVNLGSMFNARSMDGVWLGYAIHHRSAIFEKSSQYGRIKGGSNYNTVYLQFDF